MNKVSILVLGCSLILTSVGVSANSCAIALPKVDALITNVNLVLASDDIDAISEMSGELKDKARGILKASDNCGCDDAYEGTESMLDNINDAYLSDTAKEAKEYLLELKANAQATIKHLNQCDL